MDESSFAAAVVEHLEPVLAPRGFPSQSHEADADSVLFHCDGPQAVADALARHPDWRAPLASSYGDQPIPCLDLWVQRDGSSRSWTFEIFNGDVAAAAGPEAMRRLDDLRGASVDEWAGQLAVVLTAYFAWLDRPQA